MRRSWPWVRVLVVLQLARLTVGSLFEHPTLAEFAEHVARLRWERSCEETPEAEFNAQEIAGHSADPDQGAPQRTLGTVMTGAR